MMKNYDDMLNLPHPVSKKHPPMQQMDRAAQFAPFAALTGYGDAIKETARLTDRQKELDQYEKDRLNEKLNLVAERIKECPKITITYFEPDGKKDGGAYLTVTGYVKKIDEYKRNVCFTDGTKIAIEEIFEIESKLFHKY
ncbi:MAG: YolD-like family protein [Lachnospiraceae bacterium]